VYVYMAGLMGGLISLSISSIILVNVFIATVKGANTSAWTTGEVALWGTVTLVAIAGFVYGIMSVFGVL